MHLIFHDDEYMIKANKSKQTNWYTHRITNVAKEVEQVSLGMETAQSRGNTVQMCSFFVTVTKDLRKTVSGRKALCWLRVWEVPFHGDGDGVIEPSSSPHSSPEAASECYIHRPPISCILLGPQVAHSGKVFVLSFILFVIKLTGIHDFWILSV